MSMWSTLDGAAPKIIAHRGASGLRPEHTLPAYRLAIAQGADIIEPDLVPSLDGVLFARHERGLGHSTDIARRPEFAAQIQLLDNGRKDWLAERLNSREIEQLRALQPFPGRDPGFDAQFGIPRFDQVIALAREQWTQGHSLGVYPEIKHPNELRDAGIDATGLLIAALRDLAVAGGDSPVWVQCFERWPLQRVKQDCGNPVFALFEAEAIGAGDWLRRLRQLAPWLDGVALPKAALIGATGDPELIARAHDLGWQVHVWTLRDDAVMAGFDTVQQEYAALFEQGVDALFCDFPDSAVAARKAVRGACDA